MREDFERVTLDELSKRLRSVTRLVDQIAEEGTKLHEMLRNSCALLKIEVEQGDAKRRVVENALQSCYSRQN